MNTILKKSYVLPQIDKAEVLRYAGGRSQFTDAIEALIDECIKISEGAVRADIVYFEDKIISTDNSISVGDITIVSRDLLEMCAGKSKAVIFAATVGIEIDRLIAKYGKISPSKSLVLQAIGAERVEALCDLFCEEYKGRQATTRKSPGYGDIPLTSQSQIVKTLDAERKIGLTLNESLMLSPTKSVTAIFAIE